MSISNQKLNIRTYQSPPQAFFVNSHLIETPNGVVVIDTQFLVSQANAVKSIIAEIGKPLLGIVITHPHPDHYNGAVILVSDSPKTPIFATQATLDVIKEIEGPKRTYWQAIVGDEYPSSTAFPNEIVASGSDITLDGLTLNFQDFGAGEADNETVIALPAYNTLFPADIIYNKVHPWLAEGRSGLWLEQIDKVISHYPNTVDIYVGHGEKTDLAGFAQQRDYINYFRELIALQQADGLPISDTAKEAVIAELTTRFPGYPLEMVLDANIEAVAKELGGE